MNQKATNVLYTLSHKKSQQYSTHNFNKFKHNMTFFKHESSYTVLKIRKFSRTLQLSTAWRWHNIWRYQKCHFQTKTDICKRKNITLQIQYRSIVKTVF